MPDNTFRFITSILEEAPEFDLACIGTSISGLSTMTMDSIRYLVHADIIYAYPVTESHLELMKLINPNVIDLNDSFYRDGNNFQSAYASIIDKIFEEVCARKKVVYASQGSPAFLAYTSIQLMRRVKLEGLRAKLIPGVSSFECLLAHLIADFDIYDVQLYNCSSIIAQELTIYPKVPCLLFNLLVYANLVINKMANKLDTQRLELLIFRLGQIYPKTHPVSIITVNPSKPVKYDVIKSNLIKMQSDLLKGSPTATIFLPCVQA